MKLIKPKNTKAILIGVSEFEDNAFIDAPPIANNVLKLAELFQNHDVLGLEERNVLLLNKNERHDQVLRKIRAFIKPKDGEHIDTLIFYFAGHGYKKDDDAYYLTTHNSNKKDIELSAIPWTKIKTILEKGSGIQQRLYILDACHSGAAALGDDSDELNMAEGSALIAAAKASQKAYFNASDTYTYFTQALVDILEKGINDVHAPHLRMDNLVKHLKEALKDKRFDIQPKYTDEISGVGFFKNKRYDKWDVKRKDIMGLIEHANAFLEKLDFDKAESHLSRANRKAKPKDKFNNLLDSIQKGFEELELLEKYMPRFENYYTDYFNKKLTSSSKFEKENNRLKQKLVDLEVKFAKAIQNEKDQAEIINTLKQAKKILEKENEYLKKNLKRKTGELAEANANIKELKVQLDLLEEALSKKVKSKQNKNFTKKVGNTSFEMIFVEGGTFKMGDELGDLDEDSRPVHEVKLSDYYIAQVPVTQKLWQEVMGENPSHFKSEVNPVDSISWNEAQKFIEKLNTATGENFRLPTEAEWEYAARGGKKSKGYQYAGSNEIEEVAWYGENSKNKTRPVCQRAANELGLYDMSGNVWEWCSDWYAGDYYKSCDDQGVVSNPEGASNGSERVIRGGGWYDGARYCRVSYRFYWNPISSRNSSGFRFTRSSKMSGYHF